MSGSLTIRRARAGDLAAIVGLHAGDPHGHGDGWNARNEPRYARAFAAIAAHPDHALFVAEDEEGVVGTFLLSVLPGLTGQGETHAQLRSVQVRADRRSRGIGAAMVAAAEREARDRGAAFMELTSNARRHDAHRFYEREGYVRSHAGFKKRFLPAPAP